MIRIAGIEDLDTCSRMALEFIRKTAYALFYDEGRVVTLVKHFLLADPSERVIFLCEDKGMIACVKLPFLLGEGFVANELAWWVNPENREEGVGEVLLEAYEYWAKKNNCKFITMDCMDDLLGKFYEKKGYQRVIWTYMKQCA